MTHPAPTIRPSLLRLSAPQRIAVTVVLIAMIWASALWAMH
jgi:hypothetical protein